MDNTYYELIEDSIVAAVYRVRYPEEPLGEYRAVKVSSANRKFAKEPHDICKEIRILSQLSHPNIIAFLGHDVDSTHYRLWMQYIPYTLKGLLACPSFAPSPYHASQCQDGIEELMFSVLTKSIFHQVLQALEYLHHPCRMIAHRDIKPGNILLTTDCQVKLIDFGIAWKPPSTTADNVEDWLTDFWPEPPDNMYTEVATGPYRAPELLFGPTSYDSYAADIWSLGATFAEFFTPLRLCTSEDDDFGADSGSDSGSTGEALDLSRCGFIVTESISSGDGTFWQRVPLFNAERGDIGLAWSIFKIRGTPNEEIWPTFYDLHHANRVQFDSVPPANLRQFLPNLPSSARLMSNGSVIHTPPDPLTPSPLDLVTRMLVYPQTNRLRPDQALQHPWFVAQDVPLVLPVSSARPSHVDHSSLVSWKEHDLGYWLRKVIL